MGLHRRPSIRVPASVATAPSQQQMGPNTMFMNVPLAKRVNHLIEWSGSGILLDMASAALSLLTVFTYMVETGYSEYDPIWQRLRVVDQVCSAIFAAEWCFWLWLARDRLGYILSWQSLVDIVTIVPIFLSALLSARVPGFATFEAMVRIFRVVRVFRIFRLGKRLKNEVLSRLLTLVFTLVAVIVTAAGVFYEIETRFGERYPDLTIMQAIYWSVVTATTIGYGDFSPSITASQMTLLAMLLIAFTLLPYQTSMLVNALSETSVYQSAHYSHTIRGHHIVVTGHLTADSAESIVEQVFHPDSGFSDYNLVFLHPSPPTDAMKRLLKTSQHSHRLLYLQGSWASQKDLARTQVDSCDAVFVLCDKAPPSAEQEDLQTIMACLAIGQYIQRVEKARSKVGPKPLMQRLLEGVSRFALYFRKAKKATSIPRMCIQLLLPESKQQLHQLLNLYSKHGLLAPPTAAGTDPLAAEPDHDAAARIITKQSVGTAASKAAALPKGDSSSGKQQDTPAAAMQQGVGDAKATADPAAAECGRHWWQRFSRQVTCICITELRYGLLAQSCMGCSGAITLVSNLVRSIDDGVLTQSEFEGLPEWAQEYLEGSSNELYEVAAFPACLHGQTVAQVAEYVLGAYRAVLIATAGTSPCSSSGSSGCGGLSKSGGQDGSRVTGSLSGDAGAGEAHGVTAGGPDQLEQELQQPHGQPGGRQGGLQLSAQTLGELVTGHTAAYVIASDVRVVIDIMESTADDYLAWKETAKQQAQQHAERNVKLTKHSMAYQPAAVGAIWKAKAAQHRHSAAGAPHELLAAASAATQQHQLQQPAGGSSSGPNATGGSVSPVPNSRSSPSPAATGQPSIADKQQEPQQRDVQHTSSMDNASTPSSPEPHAASVQSDLLTQEAGLAAAAGAAAGQSPDPPAVQHSPHRGTGSRRATGEPSSAGTSFKKASAAVLKGVSARSLLAATSNAAPGTHDEATPSSSPSRRRRLGAIQVATRGAAVLADAVDDEEDAAGCVPGSRPRPLPQTTPSQRLRSAMELRMQQLYHTRDWSRSAAECIEAMAQDEVHLEGHLLVCGCGTPPAALACLLKPLRSTALPGQQRSIVVLDTTTPEGPEWEELSRLSDVFHVQGNPQSSQALVRACADTAATAVVLLPWSQPAAAADVDDIVTAGMVDAGVLSVVRRLRALNPWAQIYSELNQNQSLRFLDPLGSLLDGCAVDEATAAAASPAFMCGAVLLPLTDILLCQAVNNRGTPQILASMLTQWHRQPPSSSCMQQGQHAAALPSSAPAATLQQLGTDSSSAGSLPGNNTACQHNTQSSMTAAAMQHQDSGQQSTALVPLRSATHSRGQGAAVLQQVSVPVEHCGTFGELFAWLLCQGMLCCGLYRQATFGGTPLSYVYTNPHKDTPLRASDRAFVLAATALPETAMRHQAAG